MCLPDTATTPLIAAPPIWKRPDAGGCKPTCSARVYRGHVTATGLMYAAETAQEFACKQKWRINAFKSRYMLSNRVICSVAPQCMDQALHTAAGVPTAHGLATITTLGKITL